MTAEVRVSEWVGECTEYELLLLPASLKLSGSVDLPLNECLKKVPRVPRYKRCRCGAGMGVQNGMDSGQSGP